MSPRAQALAVVTAMVVLTAGMVAWAMSATPPTGQVQSATTTPAPPTTAAPPTTEAPDCTATTNGRDPEAFQPRCRGPIVVEVTTARCLGDVGDGYHLAYRITNSGPAVTAYVQARVDDKLAIITEPSLELKRGGSFTDAADYHGVAGDGLTVSLVSADGTTVDSFAAELPHCRQDPADIRKAREATTTT